MKHKLLLLFSFSPLFLFAQPAPGYYDAALNKTGFQLKVALHEIIKGHTEKSYNYLWTAFQTTDKKTNGKVWDIYSNIPNGSSPYEYTFGTDQCGNYNAEGDCYNREHTWPQSHFNSQAPMKSDLYAIYPTDGYANQKRSNYAYGIVTSTNPWVSQNGSKLGGSSPSLGNGGGIVFEPIDEYKGDLARTYFYVSTRYYNEDGGWNSWSMANGADLKPWAAAILLDWHVQDPVSQKEVDRNNAVHAIQHNRNPFIDYPEFADCIWGTADCSTTGILAGNKSMDILIYPNPATDQIFINLEHLNPEEKLAMDIFNIQGVLIYHKDFPINVKPEKVDITGYAKGIYWIKIQTSKENIVKKIVVQ